MRRKFNISVLSIFFAKLLLGQFPSCPSPYVWMDGGTHIKYYDPSQPLSVTNPATINVPTFGTGLTLMPNINGGTLSPTFYSTSGGNYWYWNGVQWVNTGHSTGGGGAVNLGGCGSTIYNIVGASGQIYSYNGTGNGTLLTTIQGFNGGGPYDLVADCNCNFYALNTTNPNQSLTMYNSSGVPQCTYALSNMPTATAGGGFAIIGNKIYVKNNIQNPGGFYIGTIVGGSITFTSVPGFTNSPGDFASCPVCYPPANLNNVSISGGILGCNNPTTNVMVTTTLTQVTYSWSGPGVVGPANGTIITANTPGTYSCLVSAGGCPPSQNTLTFAVISNSANVVASITPSGNICVPSNITTQLVVTHYAPTDIITWNGPGIISGIGTATINTNSPGVYSVTVLDIFSGCMKSDQVNIAWSPTVTIGMSSSTLCAQPINGSPATMTITPNGAVNYTLLTSPGYTTPTINGPTMPVTPVPPFQINLIAMTATLIGSNSFCSDTTTATFYVVPNPTVYVTPSSASICPAETQPYSASGATTYTWSGSPGLNNYTGANVISTPQSTFATYSVVGTHSGCKSNTESATLTVKPLPSVLVSPLSSSICQGSGTTLSVTGNATSYSWVPSSSLSSSAGNTVYANPLSTQAFSVIGTLNSCTLAAGLTVHVVLPPVINIALSANTVCANSYNNSPHTITVTPSGAGSYTLFGGGNFNILSPHGPLMFLVPTGQQSGSPSIETLTLAGQAGICTSVFTKTFSIVPNPIVTLPVSTASICPGKTHVFSVTGANSYTWLASPGLTVLTNSTAIVTATTTSFFSVYGRKDGCRSDNKNAIAIVLPIPNVKVIPASSTVCAGSSVSLSAASNGISFTWTPPTGLSSTSATLVTASPAETQEYTLIAAFNTCTNSAVGMVSVIPIPMLTVTALNPTVCSGSSSRLDAAGAHTFSWLPLSTLNHNTGSSVFASPNESTTYTVHGYNGICTGSASIYVQTVNRPDLSIHADENRVCRGSTLLMTVSGAEQFTWSPWQSLWIQGGGTVAIASPTTNTNYTISGTTSMGSVTCYQQISYSVMVVEKVKAQVSPSVSICFGEKTTLFASGGNTFKWAPVARLSATNLPGVVADPTITTIYTVEVSMDSYCGTSGTVSVEVNPRPFVFAGNDTTYNLNEPVFINATGNGTMTWVSGDGIVCRDCPFTQVYPSRYECYIIEAVNDAGCTATDNVCVNITEDFSAYVPNVFTPNKDGLNDVFYLYGENISEVHMEIYDRWGVMIFSSDNQLIGWDGYYKGEPCKVDTYIYKIYYTGLNRQKFEKTGYVTLNR